MATFAIGNDLYAAVGRHLGARAEQVGFFLAEWQPAERRFVLREWRPVAPEGLEHQSDYHVSLADDMRAEVIKWAWDAGASLVEAHSHGKSGPAKFSPSDLWGFDEWVPHLWWRLRGRPYAALVTGDDTFDALAWIEGPKAVEQVERLEVEGRGTLGATGRTLAEPRRRGDDLDEEATNGD